MDESDQFSSVMPGTSDTSDTSDTSAASGEPRAAGWRNTDESRDYEVDGRRIIDLAALEQQQHQSATSPSTAVVVPAVGPRRSSRLPWSLAGCAAIAAIVAATFAVVSYDRGMTWQEIALEQQARGDALELRVEQAAEQVTTSNMTVDQVGETLAAAEAARQAASGQLDTSEGDVVALEKRVAALASEKARLEDELTVTGQAVQADAQHTVAVRQCVGAINAWLDRSPVDGQVASWQLWANEAGTWKATCDTATG